MCVTEEERRAYSPFKTAICEYLREFAKTDTEFRGKLMNPEKNIDKCLDYIIGEVKESGRQGFADDEIYSLAVHYYDESNDNLKAHPHTDNVKVVVNREMPFTQEEKAKARQEAFNRLVEENKKHLSTAQTATAKKKEEGTLSLNLFPTEEAQ